MSKTLKFDFYQVDMPQTDPRSFEAVIDTINLLQGAERVYNTDKYPIRLQAVIRRPAYYIGDIAKIRMDDIPDKMKLSGETEPIDLDDDQGLGEITSFIYNPAIRLLVLLRNRYAVSATGFAHYYQFKGNINGELLLKPLIETAALQRLAQMGIIKKFEIGLSAPGNAQIYQTLGLRPQAVLDLMDVAPKVKVDITFMMDREKNSTFSLANVQRIAGNLINLNDNNEIVKLAISGKDNPDESTDVLDLLEDIIVEKEDVNIRNERRITDQDRHHAITTVYQRREQEMINMLQGDVE